MIEQTGSSFDDSGEKELSGRVGIEEINSKQPRILVQAQHRRLVYTVLSVLVMGRAALFQQDIEAVEEIVQGSPHHPQNVPVLFVTHVEKLLAERDSQSIHLDSCQTHEGAALKMDSFFKPTHFSDTAPTFPGGVRAHHFHKMLQIVAASLVLCTANEWTG